MSGTSLDGIDGVLVDFRHGDPAVLAQVTHPFPEGLHRVLAELTLSGPNELERAAEAGVMLARCYAAVINALLVQSGVTAEAVSAIGCHGQTVRHRPERGYSCQLVNGAWLAELTGIAVVTDFRSRDLAAGGQGAPLVPACHDALFRHPSHPRLILNLGGIANLTILFPGQVTRGYDTGPANLLMDAWIRQCRGVSFDRGGEWAATGEIRSTLLQSLLNHPYFQRKAPKSTGREEFSLAWVQPHLNSGMAPEDVQATLLELTAQTIVLAVHEETRGGVDGVELYGCGGGACNSALMRRLQTLMPEIQVTTTATLGLPVHQVEAVAFAWLARARLLGLSGNLPAVTGARHSAVMGALYAA